DLLGPAGDAREEVAEGHDDVERVDGGADDVRQQGREDEVILEAEEDDLRGTARERAPQRAGAPDAREAAPQDDDPSLVHERAPCSPPEPALEPGRPGVSFGPAEGIHVPAGSSGSYLAGVRDLLPGDGAPRTASPGGIPRRENPPRASDPV